MRCVLARLAACVCDAPGRFKAGNPNVLREMYPEQWATAMQIASMEGEAVEPVLPRDPSDVSWHRVWGSGCVARGCAVRRLRARTRLRSGADADDRHVEITGQGAVVQPAADDGGENTADAAADIAAREEREGLCTCPPGRRWQQHTHECRGASPSAADGVGEPARVLTR